MSDWSLLRAALASAGDRVDLTWAELDDLVCGLPASAAKHRAFWSGDRPQTRAMRSAGYAIENLELGQSVTFVRATGSTRSAASPDPRVDRPADLVLVTCVKEKGPVPAPARELYTSALFRKQRTYAESSGKPWYILSAEHGLVAPDEWLAPYDRHLANTPRSYRDTWGAWVLARLALLDGDLAGRCLEVHAGADYVAALARHADRARAVLRLPLQGLTHGQRLAWYGTRQSAGNEHASPARSGHSEAERFVELLSDLSASMAPESLASDQAAELNQCGLYSWWVDAVGADDLSRGLGVVMAPGLIYAGLAGATRWPSGRRSTNTLKSRILGMHLGGRHEFSTFRRSLGSVLASLRGEESIDEVALTAWMKAHLRVVAIPHEDPDTLGQLERDVLTTLNPPLNLGGMPRADVRTELSKLRRPFAQR